MLTLSVSTAWGDSGLGRHKRMFAVPQSGKVVIDGKLDDWDLSGQIWIYVMQQTAEMQSARFAIMYDAEALYLSAVVRDPSPLMNKHDPRVDADQAWDADCCQVRLTLDPAMGYPYHNGSGADDQLVTLNLWFYTDRKEPCLQIGSGGNLVMPTPRAAWPQGVAPADAFQAAYVMSADKLGYTFEYRIPWKTLGAKNPPKAGDILAGNVQFNWSSPDGMHIAGISACAYDVMAGPGFAYQSSLCWGKMIFSAKGHLPKTLVEEGVPPEPPLPLTFQYELPGDGDVTIALQNADGQFVRHVVAQASRKKGAVFERWDGLDDVGKPLPAGEYHWKGIYHDPITTKHLLSVHNSGKPPFATTDGTGGWGGDHSVPTTVCAAGDRMLLSWGGGEAGWGLLRTDLDGRRQWGIRDGGQDVATDGEVIFMSAPDSVRLRAMADGRPLNYGRGQPTIETPPGAGTNTVGGITYAAGTLYVSYPQRNLIAMCDAKQGTVTKTWPVEHPECLAVAPDGSLVVTSAGKIVRVRDGKTSVISDQLSVISEPKGIAVATDGTFYVANTGKLQNISVFDKDGKYLRSIGKAGGRPRIGAFDPKGMLEPAGIAMDKLGRLWVAESIDYPKRISVWDVKQAALVTEFFGASEYATFVSMDAKRPDEVICHNVIWQIDLDKGTWHPKSTIWRGEGDNVPHEPHGTVGCGGPLYLVTAKNGRQYALAWTANYAHSLYLRVGDIFKPVVVTVYVKKDNPFIGWPPYPLFADHSAFPDGVYVWQDQNDDIIMQVNEIARVNLDHAEPLFMSLDADLNLWSATGFVSRPLRVEKNGRPVYDFTKLEKLPVAGNKIFTDPQDGSIYTLTPGGDPGFAHWTTDGKLLWNYRVTMDWRSALNLSPAKPGQLFGITQPLGVAGDFTGVATYFGPFSLFTRDGLFVAKLFNDSRKGIMGPESLNCEAFAGQLVRLEKGNRYLLLAGDTDGRITEILGLDTIKRFAGKHALTSEDVKAAQTAQTEFASQKAKTQPLVIARGKNALGVAQPISKVVDEQRSFSARIAYDAQNLYVQYEVQSPNELVNSHPDSNTIFKGGNVMDIQLAADSTADPKRAGPVPGDVRVLITRRSDKALAVIYRPKVKGFQGEPTLLTSPMAKEPFDCIEVNDQVVLDYQKTPVGFSATATLPLALLGWTPQPGTTVRMDLGYLFGNSTGNQCGQRAYWSNNSPTSGIIGDVPSESRLEPKEWGLATVE